MWIVRVALDRPYTFIVLALLILILSPVVILRTPTDIFPNINIPVTAIAQTALRQLPPGVQPPLIINYSASTVPILQLSLSGMSEAELNDVGLNFLRTQLVTVPGASIPYPYGGKQRQVMVDLDPRLLQSKGLAPIDIVNTLGQQNIVLPSGTAKIGEFEYDVAMNASPRTVPELNDLPIKVVNNSTVYIRDVAHVRDGFSPQTNVVRQDGRRGTLVTILKTGSASTLDVVKGIRDLLPRVTPTLPPALRIQPLADQSIFVRAAVSGVIREAVIAACLTAVMILFFLGGVARYLFVPLAESVIFAMLASYVLSRTLVPTLAMYLLKPAHEGAAPSRNPLARAQRAFERGFERFRGGYRELLASLVEHRRLFIPIFLGVCLLAFLLAPYLGRNFFPDTDSGQISLHMRAKTGTRIEETARIADLVEDAIRREIPASELDVILDNIGLPYSTINWIHSSSGVIGTSDADILVSLKESHRPTADHIRKLREVLPREFPTATFYFLPADMVTQILNFGLPAPIDVQIEGADVEGNRRVAEQMLNELRRVPGLVDLRIQQPFDYPKFDVAIDRTKAGQGGFTERDLANSLLVSLSGSFQTTPTFFLNWQNGVNYNLATQTPQYRIQSLSDIENIPITAAGAGTVSAPASGIATTGTAVANAGTRPGGPVRPGILADVASIKRAAEPESVSHYNIRRVVDIYGAVQDRDLGAVARDVDRIVADSQKLLPRGSFLTVRGQVDTMRNAYVGLLAGLAFAIMLVYLLIVVNFQSWLDPFIIVTALPAALAGIVWFLFVTKTNISVPALTGSIMCMGVATANSILVVSFAKEQMSEGRDALSAALRAGFTRFRPVLMTALAMIIG